MGAINLILNTATDAVEEVGRKDSFYNDGYHFKVNPNTRPVDDVVIEAAGDKFFLACIWKNLPNYMPSLPNMNEALNEYGLVVNDKKELVSLIRDLMISVANNAPDSNELCRRASKLLDRLS